MSHSRCCWQSAGSLTGSGLEPLLQPHAANLAEFYMGSGKISYEERSLLLRQV